MSQPKYTDLNSKDSGAELDPFTRERYLQFSRHLPPNAVRVLDIGCSTGRGAEVLKTIYPNLSITGLDCVENRLCRIPSGVYTHLICGYGHTPAIRSNCYDVVIAGELLEHLHPNDVDTALSNFLRILVPGGRLLLTTPNPDFIRLRLRGISVIGGAHLSAHPPKILGRQLHNTGFRGIKLYGSGKMTRYISDRLPVLSLYGSYLAVATKP